jgi:pimeloyl-ACP methyl ester carboxylesterase
MASAPRAVAALMVAVVTAALLTLPAPPAAHTAAGPIRAIIPQVAADAATGSPGGGGTGLAWVPCGGDFQCANLQVPLDYSGQVPGTVTLALIRRPASGQRIGALLTNPGGPGGSGVDFVRNSTGSWTALRQRFDIIGFDPRGVGASTHLNCVDDLDDLFSVISPRTSTERVKLRDEARAFRQGCETRAGHLLGYLSAEHVARDMDRIRAGLGEEQISYLGFSYGTLLGAIYAELFPTRVRAFALDGPIDPTLNAEQVQLDQARAFEAALDAFLTNCDLSVLCADWSGGNAQAAYLELFASLRLNPLPLPGGRVLNGSLAEIGVLAALYNRENGWPTLAVALRSAELGDGGLLAALADNYTGRESNGTYDDSFEIYSVVSCEDLDFPRDVLVYDQWAVSFAAQAPRFGPGLAYEHISCASWPVPAAQRFPIDASDAPPIVVVGTRGDPATPYQWAVALSNQLSNSALVTWNGFSHVAYPRSTCVANHVNRYLIDLVLPPDEATCS